jgi:hypothetical protein
MSKLIFSSGGWACVIAAAICFGVCAALIFYGEIFMSLFVLFIAYRFLADTESVEIDIHPHGSR